MTMAEVQHDYKKELNKASLKATSVRLAVLEFLENTDKPIDVATIISYLNQKNIKADPATVFRIMGIFNTRGLVRQIQLNEGKSRYEVSSKPDHHHLICQLCGNIEDISDCSIVKLEKEIIKKKQFFVKSHSLEFFGVCGQCQH